MMATDLCVQADATTGMTRIMGQFMSYELKDGYKVKRINLQTTTGLVSAKLTREARACLFRISTETPIQPGLWLDLMVKIKFDDGRVQYKVQDLQVVDKSIAIAWAAFQPEVLPAKTVIQVCDRGTCRKRGAAKIAAALQQTVSDRGLDTSVTIQTTGCLKNCKQGPNLAVGKACYGNLCPVEAINILGTIVEPVAK